MTKREVEQIVNAYNRLAISATEPQNKEIFGIIDVGIPIKDKDYELLRPFLNAKVKVIYNIGKVEYRSESVMCHSVLTDEQGKWLTYPNESIMQENMRHLRTMILNLCHLPKGKHEDFYTTDTPQTEEVVQALKNLPMEVRQTERSE